MKNDIRRMGEALVLQQALNYGAKAEEVAVTTALLGVDAVEVDKLTDEQIDFEQKLEEAAIDLTRLWTNSDSENQRRDQAILIAADGLRKADEDGKDRSVFLALLIRYAQIGDAPELRAGKEKSVVRLNAENDPTYAPYCLRCSTMSRMKKVESMLWKCSSCGAIHDERGA